MRYLVLLIVLLPSLAWADTFRTGVKVACNTADDSLRISYVGAYNEAGEALINSLDQTGVATDDLVRTDGDSLITQILTKAWECKLSDGIYNIVVGGAPGNMKIGGRCGAHLSAWVEISHDGVTFPHTVFHDDCHLSKTVITEILVRAGSKSMQLTEIPVDRWWQ
ncbi:hypothetical protein [Thermomonas aquatica]|uniref:Uncharacterized protein n=1 Tax=Thermomonas aquatica TaxID=2202149 RepID=A0A5B7ZMY7_9GAMM|nr:hypothetical protein [Thermomonas aquatica]QDA56490.1 hypothetical protein FHQ07_03760 [Thermomonas aquatica]